MNFLWFSLYLFFVYILPSVVVIVTAIWVYNDLKKFNAAGLKTLNPASWSALIVLFWIITFPLYLILRFTKYNRKLNKSK